MDLHSTPGHFGGGYGCRRTPSKQARRELRFGGRKEAVGSGRGEEAEKGKGGVRLVDLTEGRYLLSGASDGSAAVFDVWNATEYETGFIAKRRHILLVDKQHQNGHKFAISAAVWYPVDTGLFVTASFDQYVKVWDTNSTQVVMDFKMPGKVFTAAMSPIATTHMLIATGSTDVQWSASSEWVLMSGGCDGAIRFWDIRRAGCFRVLDQSQSQLGRRSLLLKSTTENDHIDSVGPSTSTRSLAQKRTGNSKKNSPTMRKGQNLIHGHMQQRLHPGLSSSQNRATSHYGAVTGLRTTKDGIIKAATKTRLSFPLGSDSRLRLWDIDSGCNTLVNFEAMRLQTGKPLQLAVTEDPSLVFVPCMASIKAYNLWSGTTFRTFRGHYELVNCCYYSEQDQELYTGSNERQILVWSSSTPAFTEMEDDEKRHGLSAADEDNWSD
ncbi:DNA excision repair protein ERCC-8-like isoform X2 [Panicum miliaceum]|uniref:DNA excision repair protein ERCC-8-like isoform X2 n=1 Tax=Panicum miliaceum TaxID=4540 RepID=A0A3L6SHA2_PANMI|nr:DNA excision repair protein ERCC-8-like isoform X2 [Panicum miliaceum]